MGGLADTKRAPWGCYTCPVIRVKFYSLLAERSLSGRDVYEVPFEPGLLPSDLIQREGFRGEEAEEVLYRALMEALGYGGNREAFRLLALRLPWRGLHRSLAALPSRERGGAMTQVFWTEFETDPFTAPGEMGPAPGLAGTPTRAEARAALAAMGNR